MKHNSVEKLLSCDLMKCLSLPVLAMIFLGDLDHSIASTGEDSTFFSYSNKATCIVGQ